MMPIVIPDLINEMRSCEFDLAAAGDMAGAHMMGDIVQAYIEGRQSEASARFALRGGRDRLSKGVGADG